MAPRARTMSFKHGGGAKVVSRGANVRRSASARDRTDNDGEEADPALVRTKLALALVSNQCIWLPAHAHTAQHFTQATYSAVLILYLWLGTSHARPDDFAARACPPGIDPSRFESAYASVCSSRRARTPRRRGRRRTPAPVTLPTLRLPRARRATTQTASAAASGTRPAGRTVCGATGSAHAGSGTGALCCGSADDILNLFVVVA